MHETRSSFFPGGSPFRVKGVVYRGHLQYIEERVHGGREAVHRALPSDELRQFFNQPFVAGGWYDVFPLVEAGTTCARVSGLPLHAYLQKRSEHQAYQDMSGVYRHLMRLVSDGMLMKGISEALRRYYDFVEVEVERTERGLAASVAGVPELMADWFRVCLAAYIQGVLAIGSKTPRGVRSGIGTRRHIRHGIPLVNVTLHLDVDLDVAE